MDLQLIAAAAERLLAAKDAENAATCARIAAESDLLALGVPVKSVGDTTTKLPGWKVTTTGVVNISIDAAVLAAIKPDIPAALFEQAIRYKPDVIAAGLKNLKNNEPETYLVLASALTSKPGKTSVKVERVADDVARAA